MSALGISLLLLLANGLFVAAEFALVAAKRTRMEQLSAAGSATAKLALGSMRRLSLMLSASQLGITMASLGLGHVAEPAVAHGLEGLIGRWVDLPGNVTHTVSLVIALSIVVYLHMVIGEMVPKNIAIAKPERTAQWVAVPMRLFVGALRPGIVGLNGVANLLVRALGVEPRDELAVARTADEIAEMVTASRREGVIDHDAHGFLTRLLTFRDRRAESAMVPMSGVVSIDPSTTPDQAEDLVRATGHSRLPLAASPGRITGFVHAKDLLGVPGDARRLPVPGELVRPVLHVDTGDRLQSVLVRMRERRTHLAVVADGSGRAAGIVTIEDVIEQMVGDIYDEHDRRGLDLRRLAGRVPATSRVAPRWPRAGSAN